MANTRERGLKRIGAITGTLAAAGIAGTVGFAIVAHATSTTPKTSTSSNTTTNNDDNSNSANSNSDNTNGNNNSPLVFGGNGNSSHGMSGGS